MQIITLTQLVGIPPDAGPEGPRGPQGVQGPRGVPGLKGRDGITPLPYVPYTKIKNTIRGILDAYLEVTCPEFVFLEGLETDARVAVTVVLKNTQNEQDDVSDVADLDLEFYPKYDFLQIHPERNEVVIKVLEDRVPCHSMVTIKVRVQSKFPIPAYTGSCLLEVKIGA